MSETITITIDTSGAAFDDVASDEVARILTTLANEMIVMGEIPPHDKTLRDVNGNICGSISVKRR